MSKKYYAVYPGQIKIDNEVFFGIDYKITDFINELMEQCNKQKEVFDKAINNIVKETKSMPTNGCKIRLIEILDILKEVSK